MLRFCLSFFLRFDLLYGYLSPLSRLRAFPVFFVLFLVYPCCLSFPSFPFKSYALELIIDIARAIMIAYLYISISIDTLAVTLLFLLLPPCYLAHLPCHATPPTFPLPRHLLATDTPHPY
jgi:hypothetical protein